MINFLKQNISPIIYKHDMNRIMKFESFATNESIEMAPSPSTAPAKPATEPATRPGTKPSTTPSRPTPFRRDRPSVDPAPKAEKYKKVTEDDLAKMYLKMNTGRLRKK
jgi:hypothetical protein